MRRMTYDVPKGYGAKRIGARGYCGVNSHFIRTDELADHWDGRNDPKGNHGAAIKNCIECGYAPHRAPECLRPLDGTFACWFTGSRCPVNHPKNNTMKEYRLSYNMSWTRVVSSKFVKNVNGLVLDVTGGAIEINIKAKMNNPLLNTRCGNKVCDTIKTWTVDHSAGVGSGICPGTLLYGDLHQHVGASNGSLFTNDKSHCASLPTVGTDPNNAPGKEKGVVVLPNAWTVPGEMPLNRHVTHVTGVLLCMQSVPLYARNHVSLSYCTGLLLIEHRTCHVASQHMCGCMTVVQHSFHSRRRLKHGMEGFQQSQRQSRGSGEELRRVRMGAEPSRRVPAILWMALLRVAYRVRVAL